MVIHKVDNTEEFGFWGLTESQALKIAWEMGQRLAHYVRDEIVAVHMFERDDPSEGFMVYMYRDTRRVSGKIGIDIYLAETWVNGFVAALGYQD